MQIQTYNGSSFPDQVVPDDVKASIDYGLGKLVELSKVIGFLKLQNWCTRQIQY